MIYLPLVKFFVLLDCKMYIVVSILFSSVKRGEECIPIRLYLYRVGE